MVSAILWESWSMLVPWHSSPFTPIILSFLGAPKFPHVPYACVCVRMCKRVCKFLVFLSCVVHFLYFQVPVNTLSLYSTHSICKAFPWVFRAIEFFNSIIISIWVLFNISFAKFSFWVLNCLPHFIQLCVCISWDITQVFIPTLIKFIQLFVVSLNILWSFLSSYHVCSEIHLQLGNMHFLLSRNCNSCLSLSDSITTH